MARVAKRGPAGRGEPLTSSGDAGRADLPAPEIFVSYSRRDSVFVERLAAGLVARGFAPKIDRADIYAFEDWWKRIEQLIVKADTIVFVVSPDSLSSHVCRKEVEFAASLGKRFAPVVCRRVEIGAAPPELARLNFIFLDDEETFSDGLDRLATALATNIEWIRKHTEFGDLTRRWTAAGRPGPRGLLLRSPVLEEAESWIAARPSGAPAPTEDMRAFIAESRRAEIKRRQTLIGGLSAGLVVALALAGVALFERNEAVEKEQLATRNFVIAKQTVDGLISGIVRGFGVNSGLRVETIRSVLQTVQVSIDKLGAAAPDDPQLIGSRRAMFSEFSDIYLAAGSSNDALAAATQSVDAARRLVARLGDPARRGLAGSLNTLGNARTFAGDKQGAIAAHEEALGIARNLAASAPEDVTLLAAVWPTLQFLGDLKDGAGDRKGARRDYAEALDIARKLASADPERAGVQRNLFQSLLNLGRIQASSGEFAAARATDDEALALAHKLLEARPDSSTAMDDLTRILANMASLSAQQRDYAGAIAALRESLEIHRRLLARDPANAIVRYKLSSLHLTSAANKSMAGDRDGALAEIDLALTLARALVAEGKLTLLALDLLVRQADVVSELKAGMGDADGAAAARAESADARNRAQALRQSPSNPGGRN